MPGVVSQVSTEIRTGVVCMGHWTRTRIRTVALKAWRNAKMICIQKKSPLSNRPNV